MAQRSQYQELVMRNFLRESLNIVTVISGDEVKDIARKLNDMGLLLKREYEVVCHREKTATEAAEHLVDYVQKKDLFEMTHTFLIMLKNPHINLVNKIMPPDQVTSNKPSEKTISPSSSHEIVSSTTRLEEDAPTTKGSVVSDQQPPQQSAAALAQDETDFPSYVMEASPHGECLIINNVQFSRSEQRDGSDKDAERLKSTFSELGFVVHHLRNLDSATLLKCLREYAKFDHSHRDSFVCCILTHGSEGKVQGCDSVSVSIKDLMQPFVARSCPSLIGKPKLFFIQACQGSEEQKGALPMHQTDEVQQAEDSVQEQEVDDVQLLDVMDWANFLHEDRTEVATDDAQLNIVPDWADFLFGYSTVPGYKSIRHKINGTIYIRKLCEVLKTYSPRHDLLKMLTKVNDEVSKEDMYIKGSLIKQMPQPISNLRKRVFFNRQLPSTGAAAKN